MRVLADYKNEHVTQRHLAIADFYVGVKALELGKPEIYKRQLDKCVSTSNWLLENEFFLARFEHSAFGGGRS